ncbi:hypothetical protein COLO4_32779 [Corchorus olitorius]|uniref:Uncharacterized protein n=1 Tax=Corchorus olitorius TaxID=93759 RepID=A0A1R3GY11_9ROSI|nr:hypothetical protein COLO4_32779 [Corchorus olitorius]
MRDRFKIVRLQLQGCVGWRETVENGERGYGVRREGDYGVRRDGVLSR